MAQGTEKIEPGAEISTSEPRSVQTPARPSRRSFKAHCLEPSNVGDAHEPGFVGIAGSLRCGAAARLSLQVGHEQEIAEAKFRAAGCEVLVGALSLLTERVTGLSTAEAATIGQSPEFLTEALTEIEADRFPCVTLACNALLNAVRKYSDAARDEWNGDDPLVCTCFCISERAIAEVIRAGRLTTIKEVIRECYAGAGCGSCHPLITELLENG